MLTDKVILVTGATSGIGRATANEAAAQGAKVVLGGRRAERGAEVVAEIEAAGGEALFVATDVTDEAQVKALVAAGVERFGRLDGAVNNAGILGALAPMISWTDEDWNRLMSVNLTAVMHCLRHEIPAMQAAGGGSIVNVASITGHHIQPAYLGPYGVSRMGVLGLSRAAAADHAAEGIRVNAVLPGPVETEVLNHLDEPQAILEQFGGRTLFGRYAQPSEIAKPICFLLSDAASFMTASYLTVDGGLSSH